MKLHALPMPGILDWGSFRGSWGLGVFVNMDMRTTPRKPRPTVERTKRRRSVSGLCCLLSLCPCKTAVDKSSEYEREVPKEDRGTIKGTEVDPLPGP